MRSGTGLTTTAWVAGAALAAAGVTVALSILGNDLLGSAGPVLSSAQVRADLAAQGPASPAAAPQPGRSPAGSPGPWAARNFSGGTVFAACMQQHQATLTEWIPAQGYRTADSSAGPASAVSVRFESAAAVLVVTVTCPHGRPVFLSSSTAPGAHATPAARPAGTRSAPSATTPPPPDPGQGGKGGGKGSGGQGSGGKGGSGGHGSDD